MSGRRMCALIAMMAILVGPAASAGLAAEGGSLDAELLRVDEVAAGGPFQPTWDSLKKYVIPEWYKDAKFGIFIHWGVYCVPAFGNEWYPRQMYIDQLQKKRGVNYFEHHRRTFGPQNEFGYKDFIPMFKAEKFDAAAWAKLFEEAGARYVVPVAEHHDGFPMYDCSYTPWNAAKMGPKRDVIGELEKAVRRRGMRFGVSSHRAFNWAYYPRSDSFDTNDRRYFELYGKPREFLYGKLPGQWPPQDKEFMDDWLCRTCEMVEKYQPDLVWFDFGIGPRWVESPYENPFGPHLERFTAYYYNRAAVWGKQPAINYKLQAYPEEAAVLDLERGKLGEIRELLWQTDTSVSYNSWGYVTNHQYKTVDSLVDDLVDIVSKNGCLLLNIGPKPDGTIPAPEEAMLRQIGRWLAVNGEAIYGTRPWKVYGEGPTEMVSGHMKEQENIGKGFTAQDIRFTTKDNAIYAICLAWPEEGKVTVESLKSGSQLCPAEIADVRLLGSDGSLDWTRDRSGLAVRVPHRKPCDYAFALEVRLQP